MSYPSVTLKKLTLHFSESLGIVRDKGGKIIIIPYIIQQIERIIRGIIVYLHPLALRYTELGILLLSKSYNRESFILYVSKCLNSKFKLN